MEKTDSPLQISWLLQCKSLSLLSLPQSKTKKDLVTERESQGTDASAREKTHPEQGQEFLGVVDFGSVFFRFSDSVRFRSGSFQGNRLLPSASQARCSWDFFGCLVSCFRVWRLCFRVSRQSRNPKSLTLCDGYLQQITVDISPATIDAMVFQLPKWFRNEGKIP